MTQRSQGPDIEHAFRFGRESCGDYERVCFTQGAIKARGPYNAVGNIVVPFRALRMNASWESEVGTPAGYFSTF